MEPKVEYFSQVAAATMVDAESPPCGETMKAWHDKVGGPRESGGRRIYTRDVVNRIVLARKCAEKLRGRRRGL